MTTIERVHAMSQQERALFLSLHHYHSWKRERKNNWAQSVQQFATALAQVENHTHPAVLGMIYGHPRAAYPDQLKRILNPYIHGSGSQMSTARELRQRLEMIKAWPKEWLNEATVTVN